MKTLVFSDSHLSLPFEEKKFNFLSNLINNSDKVIINGDFWEGYLIRFEEFIESPWKNLFPLLKEKQTIYIYGNHDKESLSDNQISLFSTEQYLTYKLQLQDKTIIFEHGDRLHPFGEDASITYKDVPIKATKYADKLERLLIKTAGSRYQKLLRNLNKGVKQKLQSERVNGEYYVIGHTHSAEVDHIHKFINTGIIKHGLAQYMYIQNNELITKEEKYE